MRSKKHSIAMLNLTKLAQELRKIEPELWFNHTHQQQQTIDAWHRLVQEQASCIIELSQISHNPQLREHPLDPITIAQKQLFYHAVAVDGSQVYPDRHEGIRCSLLNIAGIHIDYQESISCIAHQSSPFIENSHTPEGQETGSIELDCKRFLHELEFGLIYAQTIKHNKPVLVLIDGALIFWQISESPRLKQKYFEQYCKILHKYCEQNIALAGYTSCPHSRDLVNLTRTYEQTKNKVLETRFVIDADIMHKWLVPYQRSPFFESRVTLALECQEPIRPIFFYVQIGNEIARIEFPNWIIQDKQKTQTITQIIIDQCNKGHGYPLTLALAHEHAVIKSRDKDIFYAMLKKRTTTITTSTKKMRKNRLAI